MGTRIRGENLVLRGWARGDEDALVRHADNPAVARNLMDRFPHPYTRADAESWIARCEEGGEPATNLAICVDGGPVGGIGLERGNDVHARCADVGYWLGENYWGRGLATAALRLVVAYAFERFDFLRLEAGVFDRNPASARVLEKAGFRLEARHRAKVFKEGRVRDELVYALLEEEVGCASR